MLLSSLDSTGPLHFGENDADYNPANSFGTSDAIFPSESIQAHVGSLIATPDFFTTDHEGSSADEHARSAWRIDHGLPQSLPSNRPSPIDQLYSGHSPSPATTALYGNIENRESTSTPPLPRNPVRAYKGPPRRKSRYMIQELDQRANAIFIPPTAGPADPLERWKQSAPEGEAASLSAIKNALENPSIYPGENQGHNTPSPQVDDLFQNNRRPASRAPSATSGESATSASSRRSGRSGLSALSNGSQTTPDKTSAGIRKKHTSVGRKKRSSTNNPRIFCCTFCCDKFKSKFDWMRHEKSLHLKLENWACAPYGGSVVLPSTGRAHCAYCNRLDPTQGHLNQHNHGLCQQQIRTFRRKDHLLQHLRLFHHLDTMPLIDDWKRAATDFSSRCGFCGGRMSNWDERADHLPFTSGKAVPWPTGKAIMGSLQRSPRKSRIVSRHICSTSNPDPSCLSPRPTGLSMTIFLRCCPEPPLRFQQASLKCPQNLRRWRCSRSKNISWILTRKCSPVT